MLSQDSKAASTHGNHRIRAVTGRIYATHLLLGSGASRYKKAKSPVFQRASGTKVENFSISLNKDSGISFRDQCARQNAVRGIEESLEEVLRN